MNDSKPVTTMRCNESDGIPSSDQKASSFCNRSAYLSGNPSGYVPLYNPVYYPGSYNHLSYSSASSYNLPVRDLYNNIDFSVPNSMTMAIPSPHNRNWNRYNLPSPLTASSSKGKSTCKPQAKATGTNGFENKKSSSTKPSQPTSSKEYIDPKILAAAHALKLPQGGQKYSVEHWKGALGLCYRWKTNTNEDERQFYRKSTSTNSISSSTLKSIKFFCENILQRKTKRRQFAIHWKESGLKKIVDESSSSSDKSLIKYNNLKLERVLDDYFSGRTRSNGYSQAKERVLEDRQKEILNFWDELMSGPVLSNASSHHKLYLIQLAIERPYNKKKVKLNEPEQKIVHDVLIEGYGGKSYWEETEPSPAGNKKPDASRDLILKPFQRVLPINETMTKRFWECADACCSPKRQDKKRRMENDGKIKNSHELPHCVDDSLSNESLNTREVVLFKEDKENERSKVVAV